MWPIVLLACSSRPPPVEAPVAVSSAQGVGVAVIRRVGETSIAQLRIPTDALAQPRDLQPVRLLDRTGTVATVDPPRASARAWCENDGGIHVEWGVDVPVALPDGAGVDVPGVGRVLIAVAEGWAPAAPLARGEDWERPLLELDVDADGAPDLRVSAFTSEAGCGDAFEDPDGAHLVVGDTRAPLRCCGP